MEGNGYDLFEDILKKKVQFLQSALLVVKQVKNKKH
jgi:hypothetical protein